MNFISSLCATICDHCKCRKDAILLVVRVVIGVIFFQAGLGKLMNLEMTAQFFAQLGIPMAKANAIFVAVVEFAGGAMLILGYKTRLVSVLLTVIMIVAILTAKISNITSLSAFIRLQELDYVLFFLILASVGGGKLSLDNKCGSECCKS